MNAIAADLVLSKLSKVRPNGSDQWTACCPAHEDSSPSLSVRRVDGRVLLYCHAGCQTVDIVTSLGLSMGDLFDDAGQLTYRYDSGRTVHRSYDKDGRKQFRQQNTDKPVELYRLSRVREAVADHRPILLCEGEEDVRAAESAFGIVATTAPQGAGNWSKVDYTPLVGATVLLAVDNDEPGLKRGRDLAAHLRDIGVNVADIVTAKHGNDVGDHVAAGGNLDDLVRVTGPERPAGAPATETRRAAPARFDASWLMAQEFPPITYVVDGVIPEGMTLLVAAPKIGKSWMVLGLALAVSTGHTTAFGCIPVGAGRPVLYLALEDGPRRLQGRIRTLEITNVSERLEFVTALNGAPVTGVIRNFLEEHSGEDPVVILDTLGKVKPSNGNGDPYAQDYAVMSALKGACDAVRGSSLIIVHHTRKHDASDFLDAVSGTQGIAGAADTVMLLKRERHDDKATLHVTSRDAAEGEYALVLNGVGRWELDGYDLAGAAATAATARATSGVGDRMTEVIETVRRYPEGIAAKDLQTLLPDVGNVREYLRRAYERNSIRKLSRGLYGPVTTVTSVTFQDGDVTHVTEVTPSLLETGDES